MFRADLEPRLPAAERARFDARSVGDLIALTDIYPGALGAASAARASTRW